MASIRFKNVWKRYGLVEAVKDLSFLCEDGELLALLGPSGCGKTTTLKMIAGIEIPDEGEIYFDNQPVSNLRPGERNIAMVFEDYALYPHLSVAENIAFPLKLRKLPAAEVKAKVQETLRLLDMLDLQDDNVKKLSGGAQQRVSIGRAFVRDPELIIFDEPLSHLDGNHKVQLRGEIKRLQKEKGLTSILVTHDQTEAIAMSDRVAVMNQGVLNQVSEPQELYDYPANLFVANFIGEPPMNLLPGELHEGEGALSVQGEGWSIRFGSDFATRIRSTKTQAGVVLGIRPEHVRLIPIDTEPESKCGLMGKVFSFESRGDASILLVQLSGATGKKDPEGILTRDIITAEGSAHTPFREDDLVEIRFMEDQFHIFDGQTGVNLFSKGRLSIGSSNFNRMRN